MAENLSVMHASHHITILDNGRLKINSAIIDQLVTQINKYLKCATFTDSCAKIKAIGKVKIETKIVTQSVPLVLVKKWNRYLGLTTVPGLDSNMDVENGKYEGGFKVWESTADLVKFVAEHECIDRILQDKTKFKSLELGCGASLPTIALLERIKAERGFSNGVKYRTHVQDYNWQVMASLSLMNFAFHLGPELLGQFLESGVLRFHHGEWEKFRPGSRYRYHLIMMSEVIYNSSNFDALHKVLEKHLKKDGHVVIATKDTYFGLSGGLHPWLEYVNEVNTFRVTKILKTNTANIPRSIVIMQRNSEQGDCN